MTVTVKHILGTNLQKRIKSLFHTQTHTPLLISLLPVFHLFLFCIHSCCLLPKPFIFPLSCSLFLPLAVDLKVTVTLTGLWDATDFILCGFIKLISFAKYWTLIRVCTCFQVFGSLWGLNVPKDLFGRHCVTECWSVRD